MAASHPHLFQSSIVDKSEIHKLLVNHFLPDRVVLQWHPAVGEDLPTPNTNEIVVFSSFQRGFSLPACNSSVDSLITTKLNWSISTIIPFSKSPFLFIFVKLS
jgi:hypothetical protein